MSDFTNDEFWSLPDTTAHCVFWKNKDGPKVFLDKALLRPHAQSSDKNMNECIQRCIDEGLIKYPTDDVPSLICVCGEKFDTILNEDGKECEMNMLDITNVE